VLSWGVSITMEEAFCVETLEDALARHGKPDIFTDQGSQFAGSASPACSPATVESAWTVKGLAGQCVRPASMAQRQMRGMYLRAYESVSGLAINRYPTFIMADVPTRALTAPRPIKPTHPTATPLGS
jgi:putative transposase